jgi:hypothetical protein
MKNLVAMVSSLAAILLMIGLVPQPAMADAVYVGDTIKLDWASSTHNPANGGPFLLTDLTTNAAFLTFCLEMNEYFSPGAVMSIDTISKAAVKGGLGGGNPDPISQETAWLYKHFREGDLWSITGISQTTNNTFALQDAIWMLEEEKAPNAINPFINFLVSNSNVASSADLAYVSVVNPVTYYANGAISAYKQSQLTYSNVPEPGSLVLLGTGIAALGFAYKRKRK